MHTTLIRTVAVALVFAVTAIPAGARTVIQNKGSDTLVNVAQAWAENYQNVDAEVAVAVSGGGSGTGIAAMINGTVDIANASRQMKQKEVDQAKSRGQDPVEHIVGYDALAVFLHPDNPLDSIGIPQIAEIYGEEGETESWGQLGVEVPGCKDQEIILVSRQNNSGTYALLPQGGARRQARLQARHPRHARLEGRRPPGREHAVRHRVQRPRLRDRSREDAVHRLYRGRGLRPPERRDRERRQLPHRASAVHVHQRRAAGGDQELSRLDPERRGPVHHPRQGLRAGARGPVQLSTPPRVASGRSLGAPS